MSEVCVFLSPCKGRILNPVCVCLTRNMEKILLGCCMLSNSLAGLLEIRLIVILRMINVRGILNFTTTPRITFCSSCFKCRDLK